MRTTNSFSAAPYHVKMLVTNVQDSGHGLQRVDRHQQQRL